MRPSPQVISILSAFIEEKVGIRYTEEDASLIVGKISERAQLLGFESLLDYYYLLRYDDPTGAELDALIDLLVVSETYFFRELGPLEVIVSQFVEPIVARGARARVWCAACATGEEPLTLAMLLSDRGLIGSVELVASDVSLRNLDRARGMQFGARALRRLPDPELAARFVETDADGNVRLPAALHRAIQWRRVNLVDPEQVRECGTFDVIICRNVLIYFGDDTASKVVSRFHDALHPGGVLLVGVSESLLRFGTTMTCEERSGTFVYRKAET